MLEQHGIGGKRIRRRGQQRVAIGLGLRDCLGRDVVAAAGPIFHCHRLTPQILELIGDDPCRQVNAAAGGRRTDDLDRVARKAHLGRLCARRSGQQGAGQSEQSQEMAEEALHG
jgi:hypothetical protein